MTADAPANTSPSPDSPDLDGVLVLQVPDWYVRLNAAADNDAYPMSLREDIAEGLRYVAELHLSAALADRQARDAQLASGRSMLRARDAEDALRTALLAADDNLTPHVAAEEAAGLRAACRAARAVVNDADDRGIVGSGDAIMFALAGALAAVNL